MRYLYIFTLGWGLNSGLSAQAPDRLMEGNYEQVAQYVELKSEDENYQKVTWHDTVLKGHQLAQKEDKPLLLWLYFGDPRATC